MALEIDGVKYLTYKEAGERLGMNNINIANWVKRGKITGYKFGYGKESFVRASDIEEMSRLLPIDNSAQRQDTNLEARISQVERQIEKLLSGGKVFAGR